MFEGELVKLVYSYYNYLMKFLSIMYKYWMKFLKFFGNFQMFILLTLIYIIFIPILWLLIRIFSDSLNLKTSNNNWIKIKEQIYNIDYFKLQG